jgi:hypothetical protein
MAEGLRVMSTNPAHAGKTIVIQDHSRVMGHNGEPKTYAIPLDGQAAAVVSETVWARLQSVMARSPKMPTLILVGTVAEPKTMRADGRVFPSVLLAPDGSERAVAPISTPVSF